MKGLLSVISAVAIVTAAAGVSEAGIGFRATGGYSHISYGDFNDWVDEVNESLASGGAGEIDNIKWVPEFGGEFYYSIVPMFEIGVGAGMMMGNSEYSFTDGDESVEFEHKIKAFPINANFYFKPNVPFSGMKPYLYAGGAMYYTKLDFGFKLANLSDEGGYDAELSTWGFGIHGGGGMEFPIIPSLSLDVGFKIRWASIGGFEGTATDLEGETRDVFLAGFTDDEGNWSYGPAEASMEGEYDEGKVDLTGYTIYIGFKAGF